MAAAEGETRAAVPPYNRDPAWFAPVFVLCPARSYSSVVTGMLGQHPQLCGFPELALFRRATMAQMSVDPPHWKGHPGRYRLAGLHRAIAQHHTGEQTEQTIQDAAAWLDARGQWTGAHVYDHLLTAAEPRVGIQKSPEDSSRDEYLKRLVDAYPRARFIHLTRHPVTSATSMYAVWSDRDYWTIDPELFHHFCVGVWYFQHARIKRLTDQLPGDRWYRVRAEDVLTSPDKTLAKLCRWLGLDRDAEAIDAMRHPERSPYTGFGPNPARGGADAEFLRDPVPRAPKLPASLDLPSDWLVDPWLRLAALELAQNLGYTHQD